MHFKHKTESVWFLLITAIYFALSFIPVLQNFRNTPPDRYYYGAEEYPLDMTGNLANIWEGYNGHWLRTSKFTSTISGPPTALKFEYIAIGQLARATHIDPLYMFYVTRFLLTVAYLFVVYRIVRSVFPSTSERIVAYLLVFFAASVRLPWQPLWKSVIDGMLFDALPFVRLTQATHHYLLGGMSALLSVYFLAKAVQRPSRHLYVFIASASIFLTSWVYAPNTVLVILSVAFVCAYWIVQGVARPQYRSQAMVRIGICFVFAAVAIIPIAYVQIAIRNVWDWNVYGRTETLVPFEISWERYLLGIGFVYPFAILGAIRAFRGKNLFLLFLAPWVFVHPFGEFILAPLMHINRIRFFLSLYFVVFGILGAAGIHAVAVWFTGIVHGKLQRAVVALALTALVLIPSYWTYEATIKRQYVCFCMNSVFDYSYPKRDIMQAIWWLRNHTKEHDIVMSGYFGGTLIPAFAGNDVYVSWWLRLSAPEYINPLVDPMVRFYRNGMSDAEALSLMKQHNIAYVLFSEEEQALSPGIPLEPHSWLTEVARFGTTVLYKVTL